MSTIELIFSLLLFHVFTDWILQDYTTAMTKTTNGWVRFRHSFVYGFMTLLLLGLGLGWGACLITFSFLTISHYYIDTYKPVYWVCKVIQEDPHCSSWDSFVDSWKKPRQLLMYVMVDQFLHLLAILMVVATMTPLKVA